MCKRFNTKQTLKFCSRFKFILKSLFVFRHDWCVWQKIQMISSSSCDHCDVTMMVVMTWQTISIVVDAVDTGRKMTDNTRSLSEKAFQFKIPFQIYISINCNTGIKNYTLLYQINDVFKVFNTCWKKYVKNFIDLNFLCLNLWF